MNENVDVDWYLIKKLFESLENYNLNKISNDFKKEGKIYSLDNFKYYNKTKLLIKRLNNHNIYIHKINCNFVKEFPFNLKKKILCEKVNGILKIYIWNVNSSDEFYNNTLYGLVSLLKYIDKYYCFNNFNLTCIDAKFKLSNIKMNIHPIDGLLNYNCKILGCCFNEKYKTIPFISYYLWSANKCFRGGDFKFTKTDIIIKYLNENIKNEPQINKLVFRGREMNYYRRKLYSLYENNNILLDIKNVTKNHNSFFIDFISQTKYKYMLDMHGLSGHSGRRFWMFHFNRVLFLPIDDPNKLFWEVSDNPPVPWVHFVPYSLNNLEEIEILVKKLENDDNLYNKIKKECKNYANTYLSFDAVCKYSINIFI